MNTAKADRLLAELSTLLNVDAVEFNEQRICGFLLDGKYRVTLLANSEERIFMYALLGEWPENPPADFSMELMTANLIFSTIQGPYIAYDPITKTLLLAQSFPLGEGSASDLKDSVESLVQHQAHMLNVLAARDCNLTQPVTVSAQ